MNVLFIGGTGIISSACSELAISKGITVYHLNRGKSKNIRKIEGVIEITADIRNSEACKKALEGLTFDSVVDWISFVPEHIESNIEIFKNSTKQYIFISSASIYQTPPQQLPVTENTPRENPIWEYSRNKIACEDMLFDAYANDAFPATIVRPSHTYDKTLLPIEGGYTVVQRIIDGKPIVIHGDGSSIWTLTHHTDFAKGLVGLLGNPKSIGEAYHITSDEWLSWNRIYELLGEALGKTPIVVHIPSEKIAKYHKEMGDSLLGDKTHSMIFDNTKIKTLVPEFICTTPFEKGIYEVVEWYKQNPQFQIVNKDIDEAFDLMIKNELLITN